MKWPFNKVFKHEAKKELAIPQNAEELRLGIASLLAQALKVEAGAVSPTSTFTELGFDSLGAVRFTGELEEWLKIELDPTLLYTYNTLETISHYLAKELNLSS